MLYSNKKQRDRCQQPGKKMNKEDKKMKEGGKKKYRLGSRRLEQPFLKEGKRSPPSPAKAFILTVTIAPCMPWSRQKTTNIVRFVH